MDNLHANFNSTNRTYEKHLDSDINTPGYFALTTFPTASLTEEEQIKLEQPPNWKFTFEIVFDLKRLWQATGTSEEVQTFSSY